ncbi:hypothetical protein GIB67_018784 [Kingdonia uniflora]|uniref:Flotillin-like n=1 Tax=Kingdonia uniflora TaxID=39325 RepID=A0A7J7NEB4_9MAGN|nr:hypothetical protein GIB67_018784 [Kingdonia uniflora]
MGQHRTTFDVSPVNYTFEVHAMSAEKPSFVFTIGPCMDNFDNLLRYERVEERGQKLQNEVANQAKIDVVEAKMKGAVGAKLRKGQTVQNTAKIDAETKIVVVKKDGESKQEENNVNTKVKIFKNQREAEIAKTNAQLATKKANWDRYTKMAEVEASRKKRNGSFSGSKEQQTRLEGGSGGVNSAMKEVTGVYRMMLPLFNTVHEQTGMTPQAWMGVITDGSQ